MSRSSTRTPCGGILEGKCCERRDFGFQRQTCPRWRHTHPAPPRERMHALQVSASDEDSEDLAGAQ